jgi:hypothetical protein
MIESVVFSVCITPLGPRRAGGEDHFVDRVDRGARRAPRAGSTRRAANGVVPPGPSPRTTKTCSRRGSSGRSAASMPACSESAKGGGHHRDPGLQETEHEPELAGPVGGRDRIDHRPQAQGGQEDHDRLRSSWELAGDDTAPPYPAPRRARGSRDPPRGRALPRRASPAIHERGPAGRSRAHRSR